MFPATEEEQLFDLTNDRQELHNLAGKAEHAERLSFWRGRLIDLLAQRADGFSDGKKLVPRTEWWGPEVE